MKLAVIVLCIGKALVASSALLSKFYVYVKVSYPSYRVFFQRTVCLASLTDKFCLSAFETLLILELLEAFGFGGGWSLHALHACTYLQHPVPDHCGQLVADAKREPEPVDIGIVKHCCFKCTLFVCKKGREETRLGFCLVAAILFVFVLVVCVCEWQGWFA